MDNLREKLIKLLCEANSKSVDSELFKDSSYAQQLEIEADHLIANGVTVQRWVPVTERLPKAEDANRFGEIMVWLRSTETQALWKWRLAVDHPEAITHWMPLPEPPKEVE